MIVNGYAGSFERDPDEPDSTWQITLMAGRLIDEWQLVKAGISYRDLGYADERGHIPRRKLREFLMVERAHAECVAIRRKQDEGMHR